MIIVDYSYDFAKIKETYPEKIGLEQMRVICHISKKTARYLLKSGLVPCIDTGKKTRQYIINTKDVIAYLKKRQSSPQRYTPPTGYYSTSWNNGSPRKTLTLREWANLDTAKDKDKFAAFLKDAAIQRCTKRYGSQQVYWLPSQYHYNVVQQWVFSVLQNRQ